MHTGVEVPFGLNPLTGRPGPAPRASVDGDKRQARHRVNMEIRAGAIPDPCSLPCVDCGHVYSEGERRHEYDHHMGYGAEHHLTVEAVCTTCHARRDSAQARKNHCIHGHDFTEENTIIARNGTRHCRECRREYDRNRGPRGSDHWKKVNAKRRGSNG